MKAPQLRTIPSFICSFVTHTHCIASRNYIISLPTIAAANHIMKHNVILRSTFYLLAAPLDTPGLKLPEARCCFAIGCVNTTSQLVRVKQLKQQKTHRVAAAVAVMDEFFAVLSYPIHSSDNFPLFGDLA